MLIAYLICLGFIYLDLNEEINIFEFEFDMEYKCFIYFLFIFHNYIYLD